MRKSVLALVLALAVLAPARPAAAAGDPFFGAWQATDPFDQSHETLAIGGPDGSVRLTVHDDYASICATHSAPGSATLVGTGTVLDNTVSFTFDQIRCRDGVVLGPVSGVLHYDVLTDTITGLGATWRRASARP